MKGVDVSTVTGPLHRFPIRGNLQAGEVEQRPSGRMSPWNPPCVQQDHRPWSRHWNCLVNAIDAVIEIGRIYFKSHDSGIRSVPGSLDRRRHWDRLRSSSRSLTEDQATTKE